MVVAALPTEKEQNLLHVARTHTDSFTQLAECCQAHLRCVDTSMANKLRKWFSDRAGFYRELLTYLRVASRKPQFQKSSMARSVIAIAFTVYTLLRVFNFTNRSCRSFRSSVRSCWLSYLATVPSPASTKTQDSYGERIKNSTIAVSSVGNVVHTVNATFSYFQPVMTDAPC